MKTAKKYTTIIIAITIVAFIIIKLFSNKKQLDNELKAMQEYSPVIPVEIITPKAMQAKQTLEENGILRSGAEVSILSETSGKVISVAGNVGEYIKAGQTLVVVEKEVLESQYKLAKTNLETAEKDLNRFNNLIGGEAITQQQLDAAKLNYQNALTNFTAVKKQLENTAIQSPVNGVISKRSIEKGTYLMPSVQVFSILSENQMIFVVKVAETNVFHLNKGQKAKITLDALPDRTFDGNIRSIGITADLSGRYEVEISMADQKSLLRTGMSGIAFFQNDIKTTGLVIPRKCIIGSIKDAAVFILSGDSVTSKAVEANAINETEVLITGGLSGNDSVVLSGQLNLQNGSKVKVINL
ncbi:MAG: efflux RND transporter periplasmic adaptor subunit [Bacteroidales bacterium]|nr:efflux RND transporter periplasmic adaptor subunit [Bacteroidales bacterium]